MMNLLQDLFQFTMKTNSHVSMESLQLIQYHLNKDLNTAIVISKYGIVLANYDVEKRYWVDI